MAESKILKPKITLKVDSTTVGEWATIINIDGWEIALGHYSNHFFFKKINGTWARGNFESVT